MQKTIRMPFSVKGVGLHTGRACEVKFLPAPPQSGIQFVRTDISYKPRFPAHVDYVVDIIRGTTLGQGEDRIYTIEHILSALGGLGIDNVVVELDDLEPPVGDGSAKDFVDAIFAVGTEEQDAPKSYFTVSKSYEYLSNQTLIRIEPHDQLEIMCEVAYQHPFFKTQQFVYRSTDNYATEIAPARTYCFDYEIEALKRKGLAKGGSLDNAIVIGPHGIYNPGSFLRFENEFVRHKILDLMGDLMLLGSPLKARVLARRCGHGHNIKFLKQLLQEGRLLSPVSR